MVTCRVPPRVSSSRILEPRSTISGAYDASGTVVTLAPSTTYYVRVYPFDIYGVELDDQQPYADIVLWDDFVLKANVYSSDPD
jgi:hypothetical protein